MVGDLMRRLRVGILLGGGLTAALGCERVLAPQHSALGDLRRQATGTGSFTGRVRKRDSLDRCLRAPPVVPGVRVEVGLWDGSPAYYRDTLTGQPPSDPGDSRFHVLAQTITDAEGRFRFDSMPKRVAYAMRVIPPKGAAWKVGYGDTMYGIGNAVFDDFPTLCVRVG
jgi:hypothetical protein